MADDYGQVAQAAADIAQAAAGLAAPVIADKTAWKYTQKSMALQNEYNKEAFARTSERQDYLMANANLIAKNALRRAGYSTADPNGTGVTPAQVSPQHAPTTGQFATHARNLDLITPLFQLEQLKNLRAQTDKTKAETEYQMMYNDLYQIYGETQMKSALENLQSDTRLKVAQQIFNTNNAEAVKTLTDAQVKNIEQRLDMDWQKLPKELQLLSAQAYEAQEKGNLSHAEINKVWQDIIESQQRVVNLQHEVNLTDAQVAVAYALTSVYAAQEGNIKVDTNGKVIENSLNRLNKDIQEGLGVGWHQAAQVLSSLIPFAGASVLLNRGK